MNEQQTETPSSNQTKWLVRIAAVLAIILAIGVMYATVRLTSKHGKTPSEKTPVSSTTNGAPNEAPANMGGEQEPSSAARPTLLGVTQAGSSEDDSLQGIAVDETGMYVFGETEGDIDGTNAGAGTPTTPGQATAVGATHTFGLADAQDVYVEKYSLDGKTKFWGHQFGTPQLDSAGGVAVNASGVYVGGKTEGSLDGTLQGELDSYIRKYTKDGTLVWSKQFGTQNRDESEWVVADESRVCIGGGTLGSFPGFQKKGNEDIFVRCYDPDGNELWTLQFGTDQFEETLGATIDASGIYVAGATTGQIGEDPHIGQEDLWYGQISLDGKLVATRQFGSKETDFGHGVAVDGDQVYLVGRSEGKLQNETFAGAIDASIGAFPKSGGPMAWWDEYGTEGGDTANDVAVDANGVYMIGTINGKTEKHAENTATEDAFIRAYGKDGTVQWTKTLATDGYDEPRGIVIQDGVMYVVGRTGGVMGDENHGAWDEFIARYQL